MIIEPILDDGKVRQMLLARGLWGKFLTGQKLLKTRSVAPQVWSMLHKEPGIVYLFYGFSGYEEESENGYVCQKVLYSPGEEAQIITMYYAQLNQLGDKIRLAFI